MEPVNELRPDVEFLIQRLKSPLDVGQVTIHAHSDGQFEIRAHSGSPEGEVEELENLNMEKLREWVNFTSDHQFRPLKSAPNMRMGWTIRLDDAHQLADALEIIYPGFVSDYYHFSEKGASACQNYPDFTSRQTGMYRSTSALESDEISDMVKGACDGRFCLKSRQWQWEGESFADELGTPSLIPCLEPCAVLMELARIQAKSKLMDQISISFSQRELDVIEAALKTSSKEMPEDLREGDVLKVIHPKRIQIMLEKLKRIKSHQD